MLFIPIPKSASSSLVETFCRQHGGTNASADLRARYLGDCETAKDYNKCRKWHSEFCNITPQWRKALETSELVGKHHFPPTQHNQDMLHDLKKVIILRDPYEIIKAYHRGDVTGVFSVKSTDFCFRFSERAWLRRAESTGLVQQLQTFYEGWLHHPGETCIIHYEQVINAPQETLNTIEAYFDFPATQDIELVRKKYTRGNNDASLSDRKRLYNHNKLLINRVKKFVKRSLRRKE